MDDGKLRAAVSALRAEAPSDVLLYNGPIDEDGVDLVIKHTKDRREKTVTLLLATLGGDAGSAFRIASLLRRRYERLRLLVSGMCKSAGTLIALAASEIVMTDTGELGPLDVQIRKRDELLQRESGMDVLRGLDQLTRTAIVAFRDMFLEIAGGSGLSSRLCADVAANMVGQLYGNIYSQIDPVRLGSTVSANAIAMQYGEILEGLGTTNLKPESLEKLVTGYPSHDFVIDRSQAEELFKTVRDPSPAEAELASLVQVLQRHPNREHTVVSLHELSEGDSDGSSTQPGTGNRGEATGSGAVPVRPNGQDVTANPRVARGSKSASPTAPIGDAGRAGPDAHAPEVPPVE